MFIALGILLANPAVLGLGKWQFSASIGVIVLFSALPLRIEAFRDVLPETKDNRWMLQILLFVLPCITLLVLKPRLWSAVLVIISIGLVHYPIVNQITSP
jgi:hypothetical protein